MKILAPLLWLTKFKQISRMDVVSLVYYTIQMLDDLVILDLKWIQYLTKR